jgi:hypothetical protein
MAGRVCLFARAGRLIVCEKLLLEGFSGGVGGEQLLDGEGDRICV